jgi:hypothetical protein
LYAECVPGQSPVAASQGMPLVFSIIKWAPHCCHRNRVFSCTSHKIMPHYSNTSLAGLVGLTLAFQWTHYRDDLPYLLVRRKCNTKNCSVVLLIYGGWFCVFPPDTPPVEDSDGLHWGTGQITSWAKLPCHMVE